MNWQVSCVRTDERIFVKLRLGGGRGEDVAEERFGVVRTYDANAPGRILDRHHKRKVSFAGWRKERGGEEWLRGDVDNREKATRYYS